MAITVSQPISLSGDRIIDAATNGGLWLVGSSGMINWGVAGGLTGEFFFNPALAAQSFAPIFNEISYYTNLKFNYVGSFNSPQAAYAAGSDITISLGSLADLFSSTSVYARSYFPYQSLQVPYQGAQGDVFINVQSPENNQPSYEPGSEGFYVILHEVLHSLGLKHPFDDGGANHPTLSSLGLAQFDHDWFTAMSYSESYPLDLIQWHAASPMIDDVIALQYLYGMNFSTNAGDTTLVLSQSNEFVTLLDLSGKNMIDVSASTTGWDIELPSLRISTIVPTMVGLAMPLSEMSLSVPHTLYWLAGEMNYVNGSTYADRVIGSPDNDFCQGNGGDDYIDGGNGLNTAIYAGQVGNYSEQFSNGSIILRNIVGADGTDTLVNIQRIKFANSYVAYDFNGNAGEAYRLYQAAFARIPDQDGVSYWVSQLDHGMSLHNASQAFINSAEFRSIYDANPTHQTLATKFYTNVLGRAPDASGLNYWVQILQQGTSAADVLISFSESPENQAHVAPAISAGIPLNPFYFA